MTTTWNPATELAHLKTEPTAGLGGPYRELLTRCPVGKVEVAGAQEDMWAAFGYDELQSVLKNFRVWSSTIATDADGTPSIVPLFADPPLHTPFRKLLNPNFPPEVVGRLEADIRRIAVEMIDALIARGDVDFSEEFAYPFPTRVLCLFLGAPDEDWPVHHKFVMAVNDATLDGLADPNAPLPEKLFTDVFPYVLKVITDHRENPRDDIVSSFINGRVGDRPLEEMEIVKLCIAMMMAGHITTTSALSNTILRLASDPELQAFLRANPDRIPDAVEESLRIDTPQQALARKCLVDTELGGETIKAGEGILTNYGSANLDPAHWTEPEKFDVDRAGKGHLAFGFGLHQCLGQHLARLEMRIVLEELLARTSSVVVNGEVDRKAWPVLIVESLPLSIQPAADAS